MTEHPWHDDQRLFADLSDAIREAADGLGSIGEFGRGAYAWRTIDEDLLVASLSFDSSLEPVPEQRSSPAEARVMAFTAAPLSVELEVTPDRIVGQIIPPGPAEIRVEMAGEVTVRIEADDAGFFQLSRAVRGPLRLRCETASARLVTEWVPL